MFGPIGEYVPYIVAGTKITMLIVLGSLALGFLIGLSLALGEVYGGRKIQPPIMAYIWFFRGAPLIVLLFLFYYGIFPALGLAFSALIASIFVLGFRSAAYQAEIFRGAIESTGRGQMRAALSIGMSKVKAICYIVLPQALRIALPGWSNEYAVLVKSAAICYVLGVTEILTRTAFVARATLQPLLPYFFAGVLFIIVTYLGTGIIDLAYNRLKIPGLIRE